MKISGAACGCPKAMVEHNFTEHINVLTPHELRKQILEAGFLVENQNFMCLTPIIQKPFQKNKVLIQMLRNIEPWIKVLLCVR